MKILIIKQLFHPEPTARSLDFALELQKMGHEIQVLTGFPSYPQGKIYTGYKQRLFKKESLQGVDVIRVPIFPYQGNRGLFRVFNYLSFAISATFIGLFITRKSDVVFAYQGALPVGIPAIVNKYIKGVPFVFDINDLWPDTLSASGMISNNLHLKIVSKVCNFTYRCASKITVLSNGFKKTLILRNVPEKKIHVINHWSRDSPVSQDEGDSVIEKYFDNRYFNILYAGNVGILQSLISVVKSFERLEKTNKTVRFIILGEGVELERIKNYVYANQIGSVKFLDRVSAAEVGKYLNSANALLVHLKDTPLFRITIPSKLISYFNVGKPILLGLKGEGAIHINKSGGGIVFEPENEEDLINKVLLLIDKSENERKMMGFNAKEYYNDNFTIEENTLKYIRLFQEINSKN